MKWKIMTFKINPNNHSENLKKKNIEINTKETEQIKKARDLFTQFENLPPEDREKFLNWVNTELWSEFTPQNKIDNLEYRLSKLSPEQKQKLAEGLKDNFGI